MRNSHHKGCRSSGPLDQKWFGSLNSLFQSPTGITKWHMVIGVQNVGAFNRLMIFVSLAVWQWSKDRRMVPTSLSKTDVWRQTVMKAISKLHFCRALFCLLFRLMIGLINSAIFKLNQLITKKVQWYCFRLSGMCKCYDKLLLVEGRTSCYTENTKS